MKTSKIAAILATGAVVMGAAAPVASAQTASQEGYDESGVVVNLRGGGGGNEGAPVAAAPASSPEPASPAADTSDGGSLPFTGKDLGIVILLAGVLLGTGLLVRRVAQTPAA